MLTTLIKHLRLSSLCLLLSWGLIYPACANADDVKVAVAMNFKPAMEELAELFEQGSGHKVVSSFASSGKHFAQIMHGARFDVFLSADAQRPQLLEENKRTVLETRFTYAVGRLVLWSSQDKGVQLSAEVLQTEDYRFLAIANPRLAPYGQAAKEVLQKLGLWSNIQKKLVQGEHVGQAYQFVRTKNAQLGFVALAQVLVDKQDDARYYLVPQDWHGKIEQQAVLLRRTQAAQAFIGFLKSEEALKIIRKNGYDVP